jgi:putative oligomerization/nucleic acid binding protein
MPFMRRRPLARAAVVGGASYAMGRRAANRQYAEQEQDARLSELESQQQYQQQPQYAAPPPPPAAPAPAAGGISEQGIEELKKLAELKEQGILTDAEFEVQKAKILQGG